MNDHNMIILNGVKKKALFSSVQIRGNSVIDEIIRDRKNWRGKCREYGKDKVVDGVARKTWLAY